jgi:hypothetical protein
VFSPSSIVYQPNMHSSWSLLSLAVSVTSAAPSLSRRAPAGAPVVNLKNGSYYGVHNSQYNQDFFLGIPFAQPPVDELRFANPESVNSTWTGALPATNYAFVSPHTLDLPILLRRLLAIKRHNGFEIRDVSKESPKSTGISMDTILFLQSIMHFYSYTRYILLHVGRK